MAQARSSRCSCVPAKSVRYPQQPGGLPQHPLLLGLLLGLLAALTLVPLTLWLLQLLQVHAMSFGGFVLFKAGFAAVLAALITPLVLRRALAWHLQNLRY